jgi:cysteine desulfurase
MMIYLDHNATTPLDPKVLEAMLPYLKQHFGNAASRHEFGTIAGKAVERAREQVAQAVNAQPTQVIFTSGGTEANNLFIKGAAESFRPSQAVISPVEHPCVMKPAEGLQKRGWKVRKLAVDEEGRADLSDLHSALSQQTGFVSVMLANNETGVIQDIAAISQAARDQRAMMHTDAVQALGKLPVDFEKLKVHAMSLSAHKVYGPKGAGALILDKRVELKPLLAGGGHERGMRSGTLNVPAIVGFGAACELAMSNLEASARLMQSLRDHLERGLRELGAILFGANAERVPNTSYFAVPGIAGETLVVELDKLGFAVASGAACSSMKQGTSEVLSAMHVPSEIAQGAVRVSLGRSNTGDDINGFLSALKALSTRLQRLTAMTV